MQVRLIQTCTVVEKKENETEVKSWHVPLSEVYFIQIFLNPIIQEHFHYVITNIIELLLSKSIYYPVTALCLSHLCLRVSKLL
jgi:hypothetical protein